MKHFNQGVCIHAGFPPHLYLFSFHSLRCGFMCSALLKAGSNADAVKAILDNTYCLPAFIAGWMDGWMPNQAAPLRYVKECAKRSIILSRFIMPEEEEEEEGEGEEDLPTEAVESMLASSETCHGVS